MAEAEACSDVVDASILGSTIVAGVASFFLTHHILFLAMGELGMLQTKVHSEML